MDCCSKIQICLKGHGLADRARSGTSSKSCSFESSWIVGQLQVNHVPSRGQGLLDCAMVDTSSKSSICQR
ncbi:hypothetical protein DUNSADRAFT_7945 [Dunaliella salina]|uniref:Encoded protein n=1 Tax=Dunaliella salina TaxID=3046 RepID=A0ABQ7H621_DUNSA|nr:hypothetical protein DUNSADRAFT_7945 [Dunaliella salina]|eukprot:KAF5842293.1 hypothetical protein DUNSADRAFT_7945 [Dunaliella salina]